MELEKIAADLYREFPKNAEKLSREMERLSGLLEETGAAIMMEIEKEKYRKDKDPEQLRQYRRIYRSVRKELESVEQCRAQFSREQSLLKAERDRNALERIDYDAFRVDETVPYDLSSVITNKKPAAFSGIFALWSKNRSRQLEANASADMRAAQQDESDALHQPRGRSGSAGKEAAVFFQGWAGA